MDHLKNAFEFIQATELLLRMEVVCNKLKLFQRNGFSASSEIAQCVMGYSYYRVRYFS